MKTFIERLQYQHGTEGQGGYYTFWVKLFNPLAPDYHVTIGGWRYWPSNQTLSTPSVAKGNGKFANTIYASNALYNAVLKEIKYCLEMPEVPAA